MPTIALANAVAKHLAAAPCAICGKAWLAVSLAWLLAFQSGFAALVPTVIQPDQAAADSRPISDESSEEDCEEEIGLNSAPRGRRLAADSIRPAARLPAHKARLVIARSCANPISLGEHFCRNGLGAPLRC
jgi:hypothetical protein